jgi:hypothetical protein
MTAAVVIFIRDTHGPPKSQRDCDISDFHREVYEILFIPFTETNIPPRPKGVPASPGICRLAMAGQRFCYPVPEEHVG